MKTDVDVYITDTIFAHRPPNPVAEPWGSGRSGSAFPLNSCCSVIDRADALELNFIQKVLNGYILEYFY